MSNHVKGIPNLRINALSDNSSSAKTIEGTVMLDAWANFQSRQGPYDAINSGTPAGNIFCMDIGGDMVMDDPQITEEHINAYSYLVEHQHEIKEAILVTLLKAYKQIKQEYEEYYAAEGSLLPDANHTNDFNELIGLSAVHILNISNDGVAYVGYEFGCVWDEEHGMGVMTHKSRLVEMGGADTSFLTWIAKADLAKNPAKKAWWKFW